MVDRLRTKMITFCVGDDGAELAGLDRGLGDETLVGFCWAACNSGRLCSAGYSPTPLAASDSKMRPANTYFALLLYRPVTHVLVPDYGVVYYDGYARSRSVYLYVYPRREKTVRTCPRVFAYATH